MADPVPGVACQSGDLVATVLQPGGEPDRYGVDYVLVPDAPRRPFRAPADPLAERLTQLDALSDADPAALTHILDGLLASACVRAALNPAS